MFASVSRNSLKAASAVAAGAVAVSVRVAFLWHEILAMTHCRLVFWRLDPFALPHRFASLRLFSVQGFQFKTTSCHHPAGEVGTKEALKDIVEVRQCQWVEDPSAPRRSSPVLFSSCAGHQEH